MESEDVPANNQSVENFTITEVKSGHISKVLKAKNAVIDEEKNKMYLENPIVEVYNDKGEYLSTLKVEKADVDMENYDVIGYGDSLVEGATGEVLQTKNLSYSSANNIIFSSNPVTVKKDGETLSGKSFKSDAKLEKITIEAQKVEINKI
jgi:LPS export ABC transporter protein LptC